MHYCWSKNSCLTNVLLYNPNTMVGMAGDIVFSPLDVVQNLLSFLSRWLRHVVVEVYVVGVTVPYIAEPDGYLIIQFCSLFTLAAAVVESKWPLHLCNTPIIPYVSCMFLMFY